MDIHFLSIGERPKNHFAILLCEDQKLPTDWAHYKDAALHAEKIPLVKDVTIHQSFHHSQLAVDTESVVFIRIKKSVLDKDDAMDIIGGEIARWCQSNEISYLSILSPFTAEETAKLVMAIHLSSYRFNTYKTKNIDKLHKLRKLNIIHHDPQKVRYQYTPLSAIISGVHFCRDLVNEPANVLTPVSFAQRLFDELKPAGVVVEILNETQMKELGMHSLLAVGQGSSCPSRMVVMQWQGGEKMEKPVAILGKGVCFDTGGISLKPPRNMHEMKFDMAGAASIAGTILSAAKRHLPINVVGIVGLVENMPDGSAIKPGDVVTSLSGQTIEILNTDAEGRLVLCDLMTYTQERFSPKYMVDLATLTGAVIAALGTEYAGIFSNDDELQSLIEEAGKRSGDKVWAMPMGDTYDRELNSLIADMQNIGGAYAGHITAAQFLKRFVKDTAWCHVDIAGMAWAFKPKPCCQSGATGYGVKLLNSFLELAQDKKET